MKQNFNTVNLKIEANNVSNIYNNLINPTTTILLVIFQCYNIRLYIIFIFTAVFSIYLYYTIVEKNKMHFVIFDSYNSQIFLINFKMFINNIRN